MGNKQSNSKVNAEDLAVFKAALSKFENAEIDMLQSTFDDLAARSAGNTINKSTFLRVFPLPGMLGERLFDVFDRKHNQVIDWQEFICGLGWFVRGDLDEKIRFMFSMYDMAGDGFVSRSEMETMLNSVTVAAATVLSGAVEAVQDEHFGGDSDDADGVIEEETESQVRRAEDGADGQDGADEDVAASEAVKRSRRGRRASVVRREHMQTIVKDLVQDAFESAGDKLVDGKLSYELFHEWALKHPEALTIVYEAFSFSTSGQLGVERQPSSPVSQSFNSPQQPGPSSRAARAKKRLSLLDVLNPDSPRNKPIPNRVSALPPLTLSTGTSSPAPGTPVKSHPRGDNNSGHSTPEMGTPRKLGSGSPSPLVSLLQASQVQRLKAMPDGVRVGNSESRHTECLRCGNSFSLLFCYCCGKKLLSDLTCVDCGEVYKGHAVKFCPTCGFNLSLDAVEPPLVQNSLWQKHLQHRHVQKGHLFKRGARLKQMKRRYFRIEDHVLYEFHDKKDLTSSHVTYLHGCYCEPVDHSAQGSKLEFGIEIIESEATGKSRVLYATTAEERDSWIKAILAHANVYDVREFYDVGKVIGTGRFSTVHLCRSKSSGREYAVKFISKKELDESEREHLRHEVAIMKLVDHPNIITLRNVFETRHEMHLVMRLASGGDLVTYISRRGRVPEFEARTITHNILAAIDYLHQRGVVHRDLKPDNILLGSAEDPTNVILGDFGFSTFITPKTIMDAAVGTLNYIAPEVMEMEGYGKEVDVWSCGVILYLLVSGALPFNSDDRDEIMDNISEGRYNFDAPIWIGIGAKCKGLIRAMLVTEPSKRITVADALNHSWFIDGGWLPHEATKPVQRTDSNVSAVSEAGDIVIPPRVESETPSAFSVGTPAPEQPE